MKPLKLTCLFAFLLASLITNYSQAQVIKDTLPWCPHGATWIYSSHTFGSRLYYTFTYQSDTIINQTTTKKLVVKKVEYVGWDNDWRRNEEREGEEYLYESNDSIYWFDKLNYNFSFIYSFNPKLGDELIVNNSRIRCYQDSLTPATDTLFITNIYSDTFSNRVYNAYSTSLNKRFMLGKIVSGIGCLQSPFPTVNNAYYADSNNTKRICEAEYGDFYNGLHCYFDSLRGYIQFQTGVDDCASIATGIHESIFNDVLNQNTYTLYPNPANSTIAINTNRQAIKQVSIYNALGSLMFIVVDETTNLVLDVTHYKQGLYLMKITAADNTVSVLRFIKN